MKETMLKLSAKIQTLMLQEEGQDLIEYALVVALIAFAATAGMKTLADDINPPSATSAPRSRPTPAPNPRLMGQGPYSPRPSMRERCEEQAKPPLQPTLPRKE